MNVTRICKECGKEFTPKGRELYCSAIHYRPCPICGEAVVAKYLSDPPRRCSKCKSSKGANSSVSSVAPKPTSASSSSKKLFSLPSMKFELPKATIPPISFKLSSQPNTTNQSSMTQSSNDSRSWTGLLTTKPESKKNVAVSSGASTFTDSHKLCQYKGRNTLGFISDHIYLIEIGSLDMLKTVEAHYDVTDDRPVDMMMPMSSMISINQTFPELMEEVAI